MNSLFEMVIYKTEIVCKKDDFSAFFSLNSDTFLLDLHETFTLQAYTKNVLNSSTFSYFFSFPLNANIYHYIFDNMVLALFHMTPQYFEVHINYFFFHIFSSFAAPLPIGAALLYLANFCAPKHECIL